MEPKSRELFVALGKIFREKKNEPFQTNEIYQELKKTYKLSPLLTPVTISETLEDLVKNGNLLKKSVIFPSLENENEITLYWRFFLGDESVDGRSLKDSITLELQKRPTEIQKNKLENDIRALEKEIDLLQKKLGSIQGEEMDEQSPDNYTHTTNSTNLPTEISAIQEELKKWGSVLPQIVERIAFHRPHLSKNEIFTMFGGGNYISEE